MKKYIYSLVFTILIVFMTVLPGITAEDAEVVKIDAEPISHYISVTYFHTTFRCPTCERIEELSAHAVSSGFADQLKSGKVVWRVINTDEPENKHYNDDYELYTKSLIISEMKDGKEERWKNLEKIWVLVRDDEKFDTYVKDEITDWLKE